MSDMQVRMNDEVREIVGILRNNMTTVVLLFLTMLGIFIVSHSFSSEEIASAIERAGIYAPLFLILLKISTVVFAPISGAPLFPLAGAFFGFWHGLFYVLVGDLIGYIIAFSLSRYFGRRFVERMIETNERGLLARIINHIGTWKGLVQMCLTFYAMPELIAYASGLSKISFLRMIVVLLPLDALGSAILVYFGTLLDTSKSSFLLVLFLPLGSLAIVVCGSWLFLRSVKKPL